MDELHVSEDRFRAIFAEFKLELFRELDKYATIASLDSLEKRVSLLELWQAGRTTLGDWQRWFIGAVLVALIGAVATLVWLAAGG
jgi:hypothetical protein